MFDFDPPNRTVTLDDIFTVANIAATYTGPELHTISVRIVSDVQDFRGYLYVYVYLPDEIMPLIKRFQQDETGYTVTSPLMPGEYMVEIVGFTHGSHNPSEWEGLTPIPLILLDHDVYLGEITMRYIGPMYYRVSGTVIDAAGNGIEGVTITMNNTVAPRQYGNVTRTGDAGAYLFSGSQYKTREDLDLTLTAAKTGWVFEPPSINLTQAYDRTLSRVEFTADFTAAPIESP